MRLMWSGRWRKVGRDFGHALPLPGSKCRKRNYRREGLGGPRWSGGPGVVDLADLRPRITPAYYPPYLGNVRWGCFAFEAVPRR
jgi:hypothetical protein